VVAAQPAPNRPSSNETRRFMISPLTVLAGKEAARAMRLAGLTLGGYISAAPDP